MVVNMLKVNEFMALCNEIMLVGNWSDILYCATWIIQCLLLCFGISGLKGLTWAVDYLMNPKLSVPSAWTTILSLSWIVTYCFILKWHTWYIGTLQLSDIQGGGGYQLKTIMIFSIL